MAEFVGRWRGVVVPWGTLLSSGTTGGRRWAPLWLIRSSMRWAASIGRCSSLCACPAPRIGRGAGALGARKAAPRAGAQGAAKISGRQMSRPHSQKQDLNPMASVGMRVLAQQLRLMGSGPRYMTCVTLFCMLRESKHARKCENSTRLILAFPCVF